MPDSQPIPPPGAPWWGRIETLWLLMAPLCALLYTLCLPLAPNDLWYHVRAGELISRGAIPTQNLMSSAIPLDTPYYYQSWLAELGLFWILKLAGLSGLAILRAFCVTSALGLVAATTFRALLRLDNPPSPLLAARLTALSSVIGLAMASNNVDLRPQSFSLLLFGFWMFALAEMRAQSDSKSRFWTIFLLVLTLIWANTHGAFVISILGLWALALADFFARRDRFRASLGVALAASLVTAINPRGLAIYAYVAQLSGNQTNQKWVQEWKSPGFDEWHSLLFWICVAIFCAAILVKARAKSRAHWNLWPVVALFGVMAARDQRSIIWFALGFVPFFGVFLGTIKPLKSEILTPVPRVAQWINAFLLLFLVGLPAALLPQIKANWPWPREFQARFAPTPALFGASPALLLENTTPVAATDYLMKNPPRGKLWNDMVCGSYLTYAGRGQIMPLCDPRIELFPDAFWEDYLRLAAGPLDAAVVLQKRGFSDILLDRENMPGLVKRLRAAPEWRLCAQNGSTLLFRWSGS